MSDTDGIYTEVGQPGAEEAGIYTASSPTPNGGSSLDAFTQAYVDTISDERAAWWKRGEIVVSCLRANAEDAPTPAAAKAKRRAIFAEFAKVGKCTTNSVAQHAILFLAFGLEGKMDPEHGPGWHRAVYHAAKRNNRPPLDVLDEAIGNAWGERELRALGRHGVERVTWSGECGDCGAQVSVKLVGAGTYKGHPLLCPLCTARNHIDGQPMPTTAIGWLA